MACTAVDVAAMLRLGTSRGWPAVWLPLVLVAFLLLTVSSSWSPNVVLSSRSLTRWATPVDRPADRPWRRPRPGSPWAVVHSDASDATVHVDPTPGRPSPAILGLTAPLDIMTALAMCGAAMVGWGMGHRYATALNAQRQAAVRSPPTLWTAGFGRAWAFPRLGPLGDSKEVNMVDMVVLEARAGNGGAGKVSFRKEKYVPKGGPDGGDGGRGGHIILKGTRQQTTLQHLRHLKLIAAPHGEKGGSRLCHGSDAKDLVVEVPLGTVAVERKTGRPLAELLTEGQEAVLVRGGKGGWGNDHFKTSVRQAPMFARPGEPGENVWVRLELKLLGDVGLVGLPNAGKSTLLATVSAARPKIADYPFTTLTPQLGVVQYYDDQSFTIADIPGIIEGASAGKGLGTQFLRHIERNAILLFLVAADSPDPAGTYRTLLHELEAHNVALLQKPRLLVITKSDLIDAEAEAALAATLPPDVPHLFISAATNRGIDALKDQTFRLLQTVPALDRLPPLTAASSEVPTVQPLTAQEEAAFPTVDLSL